MVDIGLSTSAVAGIRFAVSCLWEVAASVRVLRTPNSHAIHLPWATNARPKLVDAGLIGGLLWQLVPAEPRYLPDFLTLAPEGLRA